MSEKKNNLIVIENGQLSTYLLDDRLSWEVGRPSKDNLPDIRLYSATVSRKHGCFKNLDGMWFYIDRNGKNGTVYNGKHIEAGIRGRAKAIELHNGDIMIFGGGEEATINSKTIWAMYTDKFFNENWRVEDTKGLKQIVFRDGEQSMKLVQPQKGTVYEGTKGKGIYMGDITFLIGDVCCSGD